MPKRIIYIFIFNCICFANLYSQNLNLTTFDEKPFHFGFALSYNNSNYHVNKNYTVISDPLNPNQELSSLVVISNHGFTLGVISSININPNFKLRFAIPSLSFQECNLEYTYYDYDLNSLTAPIQKDLRPVYLDFPVMIKFRSNRIDNWAVYGISGMRFGIDMSSNSEVNNDGLPLNEQVVKLKKYDFGFEVGGGFDFFLEYFKLGIELKLGLGMINIHQNDKNYFDTPINSLKSRVWTFSLTFEG